MNPESALITGGAGFIGSSLSERLIRLGWNVTLLDNFSSGSGENLANVLHQDVSRASTQLVAGDCTNPVDMKKAFQEAEVVFHLAANPEVRLDLNDPETCFRQNLYGTHILLEAMKNSQADTIIFASSSTVYGEAKKIPTPEDYSPLEPISVYGASKLGAEALITSYCHMFKKKGLILRLANIVGRRNRHGVICDFIRKLEADPRELEILGDGRQTKSYLYIDDCVEAILKACEVTQKRIEVFNVGSEDQIEVTRIAEIVIEETGLTNVNIRFIGGVDGGRGWKGDVKNMLLDIGKLKSKGWRPRFSSEEAVRLTVKSMLGSVGSVA